ncbi:MAG: hypothetical protein AB7F43_08310 [Bacteriovoracia bacterium]
MLEKHIVCPRFTDLHIHGAFGLDFLRITSFEEIEWLCLRLGKNGIGYFAPTILSSPINELKNPCSLWGQFIYRSRKKGFLSRIHARPIGIHLEGPFLNKMAAGAHEKKNLQTPSIRTLEQIVKFCQNEVAILTIAPELSNAMAVIKAANRAGIRVQIGHTKASLSILVKAIKAGAVGFTHLFNAMSIHHRFPGAVGVLLQNYVSAEVISDGVHINPLFLDFLYRGLGPKLYAVSDSCSIAGSKKKTGSLGRIEVTRKKIGNGFAATIADRLAAGSTLLTDHPYYLQKHWRLKTVRDKKDLLSFFYRAPQITRLRQSDSKESSVRNVFSSKSLKFLGLNT